VEFSLLSFLSWYLVFLFSLICHESAHSYTAWKLGDSTAHASGQVTLDPMPHIMREPYGTVIIPLLMYFRSGWMIGWASAPYDIQWAKRYPKRHAVMALAGPASNLGIVIISLILIRIGLGLGFFETTRTSIPECLVISNGSVVAYTIARVLSIALYLNCILFLFNILPIPPLDGFSILKLIIPSSIMGLYEKIAINNVFKIVGIIIAWILFASIGSQIVTLIRTII